MITQTHLIKIHTSQKSICIRKSTYPWFLPQKVNPKVSWVFHSTKILICLSSYRYMFFEILLKQNPTVYAMLPLFYVIPYNLESYVNTCSSTSFSSKYARYPIAWMCHNLNDLFPDGCHLGFCLFSYQSCSKCFFLQKVCPNLYSHRCSMRMSISSYFIKQYFSDFKYEKVISV